jgi:hypothetical protein
MTDEIKITFKSLRPFRTKPNNLLFGDEEGFSKPKAETPVIYKSKNIIGAPTASLDSDIVSNYKSPITIYHLHSDLGKSSFAETDCPLYTHIYGVIIEIGKKFCTPVSKRDFDKCDAYTTRSVAILDKLQMHFSTIYPFWKHIMCKILELTENLEKYRKQNYLNLKTQLALQVMNISISLVILDSGLIREKVDNFLTSFTDNLNLIQTSQVSIKKYQTMHTSLLNEKGRLTIKQNLLKKKLTEPKKVLSKRKTKPKSPSEPLTPEMIKEITIEIKELGDKIIYTNDQIRTVIDSLETSRQENGQRIASIFCKLNFCYLNHPDYLYIIDWNLLDDKFFELNVPKDTENEN